jgi:SAM-dependent methyltransferase
MSQAIDLNKLWKMKNLEEYQKYRDSYEKMEKAKWFDEMIKGHAERTNQQLDFIKMEPESTVLDVGAGTGRLAIPIAKKVEEVTAIEPSPGMRACLRANIKNAGIDNINCIDKRWEDIEFGSDIAPHDVVIASYSLNVLDIKDALKKVNAAANDSVYIFNFADDIKGLFWTDDDFWRRLTEESSEFWPNYIYQLMILRELGIYANVTIFDSKFKHKYRKIEEIVEYLSNIYQIPSSKEVILRDRISRMIEEVDGNLWLNGISRSALIRWSKNEMPIEHHVLLKS